MNMGKFIAVIPLLTNVNTRTAMTINTITSKCTRMIITTTIMVTITERKKERKQVDVVEEAWDTLATTTIT